MFLVGVLLATPLVFLKVASVAIAKLPPPDAGLGPRADRLRDMGRWAKWHYGVYRSLVSSYKDGKFWFVTRVLSLVCVCLCVRVCGVCACVCVVSCMLKWCVKIL